MAWWFNLITQQVEEGDGAPNAERLGPYATREEAATVLDRMHRRNDEFDAADRWPGEADGGADIAPS